MTLRYLALGDSYTIGEGVDPADRWPYRLTARLRAQGIDVGEPEIIATTGWTTGELATALQDRDPEGPYDLVTLLVGVNDQYRGHGVERYLSGFTALLARAVELAGAEAGRVVVVSIPDWGVSPFAADRDREAIAREIDSFNSAARLEAQRRGAGWVDVTQASRAEGPAAEAYAADRLHPSAQAYRSWASLILPAARAALGARRQ